MRRALSLLLAALVIGVAAICEPFAGAPSECLGTIPLGTSVWIENNTTQAATAAFLQSQVSLIPLIGAPCADPALVAGCLGIFRPCGSDGRPAPLCPSVCDNFRGNCSSNPLVAPRLPNCTMEDPYVPGETLYEPSRINLNGTDEACYGGGGGSIGCGNIGPPFKFNNKTGQCSITCPLPPLDSKRKIDMYTLMYRITWPLTVVGLLFLFVPWALTFRLSSPFYPFFFIIAELFLAASYGFNAVRETSDVVCKDEFTIRTQKNDAGCWFQGAMLHFGVVCAATSITVLLYHVLNVVKQDKYQIFGVRGFIPCRPLWGYVAFMFGVPLVLVIVASGYPGYAGYGTACLPDITKNNRWPFDAIFEIPLIILWAMDVVLGFMIFWTVFKMGSVRALRSQIRLVALCVYYWLVQGYGCGYLMYARVVQNELRSDIGKYVQCTLGVPGSDGQPLYPPIRGNCRNWIDPPADYWAAWFSQLLANTAGVFAFLIFFHPALAQFWWSLLTLKWRPGQPLYGVYGSGSHSGTPSSHHETGGPAAAEENQSRY